MEIIIDDKVIATDKEGFLKNLSDWSEKIAEKLAENEDIKLSENHWEIIRAVRNYYHTFDLSPEMRPLVKYIAQEFGKEKGNSIYLMQLFPGSPAKLSSKIAGLPKPANCL
jgi:tRNA 2-thiouridine synthesizing protein E